MIVRSQAMTPRRDLAAELAAALVERPAVTTGELIASVRARAQDVRAVLRSDPRFALVPVPRGLPATARCWTLASARRDARPQPWDGRGRAASADPGQATGSRAGGASVALNAPAVPECRLPDAHRRWRWYTPRGRELCGLCAPPAVSTALRADAACFGEPRR